MAQFDEDIIRITKDLERAKDLFSMAIEREDVIIAAIPKSVPYKLLEEYYEVAVQLITALMYSDGLKTLSHIKLIQYLKNYKEFAGIEIGLLDTMRKFRHGTVYYGKKESGNFFINHEKEIKEVIKKLRLLAEKRLK